MPYVTFCTCAKSRDLLTYPKCVTGVVLVDDASALQIRSHDFRRHINLLVLYYVCDLPYKTRCKFSHYHSIPQPPISLVQNFGDLGIVDVFC